MTAPEDVPPAMSPARDRNAWLRGGNALCTVPPPRVERPYRLVLLGAPGVGKGTQADLLSAGLGACPLSTGEVFRAARASGDCAQSPGMAAALIYMRRGELVPDSTVLDIIRERKACLHCVGGFLLDGFPRTVTQAEALDKILDGEGIRLDAVVSYDLPIEEIVARTSGRRTCPKCKQVYHVTARPPRVAGVCDRCGGALVQREDDKPQTVRVRMEAYERSTAPLAEYYRTKGLLVSIPADGTPESIYSRTLAALAARAAPSA